MVKDYYKILQIEPTANTTDIKVAYRKLARLYHPDKNPGDKYAIAQFFLVKEAYETLTQPILKEEYLKERWLSKANNQKLNAEALDPENILRKFIHLNKKIQTYDAFRMDKGSMRDELLSHLNDQNIATLNDFNDTHINDEIVHQAVLSTHILRLTDQETALERLKKISATNQSFQKIEAAEKHRKEQIFFNKIQPFLIVLLVALLCGLIYFASK